MIHNGDKTEQIFSATLTLVLSEGFSGLKMNAVAKSAGIATGTLYLYFESKEELINRLYTKLKKKNAEIFLKDHNPEGPFFFEFEKIWLQYARNQLNYPEEVAFLEQYYRSPYLRKDVKKEADQLLRPIFNLLERGKNERLVKNIQTELLVIQLSGVIAELVRWSRIDQLNVTDELLKTCLELAWDSIKK